MSTILAIAGAVALVALFLVGVVAAGLRRRKLSGSAKRELLRRWNDVLHVEDDARRVLEGDSILDKALQASGYGGTLGEKLKKAGPRFSNENAVWAAHKLRNRIAHEPGLQVSRQESDRAVAAFRRAFDDLC